MNEYSVDKVIKYIVDSRKNFSKLDIIDYMPNSEKEAYQIQAGVHIKLNNLKDPIVGKKIGCTTKVMQNYLKINHPCAGTIRKSNCYNSGVHLDYNNFHKVGVECELAIRLKENIYYSEKPDRTKLCLGIKDIIAAIEIVDDRYIDWKNFSANYLIADDFFSAGCVLGDEISFDKVNDIGKLSGKMYINDIEVGKGEGNDILGDPILALSWLVSRKDIIGDYLPKDSVILLGSLVETQWLKCHDKVQICIENIGNANVSFL